MTEKSLANARIAARAKQAAEKREADRLLRTADRWVELLRKHNIHISTIGERDAER